MVPINMDSLGEIIRKHGNGATLDLFITPNSKKNIFPAGLNKWRKRIEIKISSPAQDNKANKELIKTIANFFDKPIRDIHIVSGEKNREKTVLIKAVTVEYLTKKLKGSINEL
jgi:hypothetical protein